MQVLDNLGNPYKPAFVKSELSPFQVDEADANTTYIRYYNTNPCAIHRILITGTVTQMDWAYGDWADRATLTYKPINDPMEVVN